jgi:homoserine dehydrogenase
MNQKDIKIGLFGFGCVGFGLYEVLAKTPSINAQIKNICVKDPTKKRPIAPEHFTYDKDALLEDPSINTIVELIDDADAAFEIVKKALQKGKAVVTANKKMIAEHFEELLQLQKTYQVPLLYEASCCASIPIIRNLEEYYNNDLLDSLEGIVNGSTNYILTQTSTENISYESALKKAQEKGYAETNPILDTGGFDAKYKLLILLAHAFGMILEPEAIFNAGIDKLGDLELNYAKEKGLKIKLVANAFKNSDNSISAFVAPKFVSIMDKLFYVDDVFNGVVLQTAFAENQFFVGKGAGAYPTASAVLSDISALGYDYKYEYKKNTLFDVSTALSHDFSLKILLKSSLDITHSIQSYFENIAESYNNTEESYIVGQIRFETLQKITQLFDISFVVFNTVSETFKENT